MYIIRNKTTKEVIRRSPTPIRADGKLPADLDRDVEVLIETTEPQPSYDAATQKLVPAVREEAGRPGEPTNLINGWSVAALSAAELVDLKARDDDRTERTAVKAMITKLKDGTATTAEMKRALAYLLKHSL